MTEGVGWAAKQSQRLYSLVICLLLDLGQDASGLLVMFSNAERGKGNVLVIPEEGVLLFADLDGVTTELDGRC
jgi:hypothetical protein